MRKLPFSCDYVSSFVLVPSPSRSEGRSSRGSFHSDSGLGTSGLSPHATALTSCALARSLGPSRDIRPQAVAGRFPQTSQPAPSCQSLSLPISYSLRSQGCTFRCVRRIVPIFRPHPFYSLLAASLPRPFLSYYRRESERRELKDNYASG